MSGICAIFRRDGEPLRPEDGEKMLAILSHRGPDGQVWWGEGPAGLGHLNLRTTPEAVAEEFPARLRTGEIAVTADCRLDNRNSLIKALGLIDRPPSKISDGEILLSAYKKWGEECLQHLLGDFAFVVWDKQKHSFFCARDHLGVKPLYYYHSEKAFYCASEIKAILAMPDVPTRLNEQRIADYLAVFFEDKSATFYENIYRLPPGHCMTIDRKECRLRCYWKPDPQSEVHFKSDQEYAVAFREIFSLAVETRLRSDSAPLFLLSGGLDSSSIVGVAGNLRKDKSRPLNTITATFPDFPEIEEREYIEAVLEHNEIDPLYVRVDHLGPLHDIDNVFRHQDEPFHAPNLFVYWRLAEAAKNRGRRVMIDGVDGDTTISHGMEYLEELLRRRRWAQLWREINWISQRFRRGRRGFLWHFAVQPVLRDKLGKRNDDVSRPPILSEEFAGRIGWRERARSLLGERLQPAKSWREAHFRQVTSGLLPFYLEVHDKAANAFGIDARHPYYDKRLVEFCLALPPEQILRDGWDRAIQRRAMQGVIPEKIRCRIHKSHWGPCFENGLFHLERNTLKSVILNNPRILRPFVDIDALQESYRKCREGTIDETSGMHVWTCVTLALWLKKIGFAD